MAKAKQMEIGAVWVKKDRNGHRYLSIEPNGPVIIDPLNWGMVAFANDKGDNENAPDFRLYITERQRQQGEFADDERPARGTGQSEHRRGEPTRGRGYTDADDSTDPFADQ